MTQGPRRMSRLQSVWRRLAWRPCCWRYQRGTRGPGLLSAQIARVVVFVERPRARLEIVIAPGPDVEDGHRLQRVPAVVGVAVAAPVADVLGPGGKALAQDRLGRDLAEPLRPRTLAADQRLLGL